MSKAIRVKKGNEILEIQDSDLQAAVKDGYLPTERVIVANSKTNESYEIDPQDLPNAFKDGFTYSDVKKKVGGLGAAVGGVAGGLEIPSTEKVELPPIPEMGMAEILERYKPKEKGILDLTPEERIDPLKSITQSVVEKKSDLWKKQQAVFKSGQLYPENGLKYLKESEDLDDTLEDIKKSAFPNVESAQRWKLANPDIKNNKTSRLAQDVIDNYNNAKESFFKKDWKGNLIPQPVSDAAVKFYSQKDNEIGEKLRTIIESGKPVPQDFVGQLVTNFLKEPVVKEISSKDKEINRKINEESIAYWNRYPNLANDYLLHKISEAREKYGENNWFFNQPGVKSSDEMVDLMVKNGELTPQLNDIYKKFTRPYIDATKGLGIETPGLVESFTGTLAKGIGDISKTVYSFSQLKKLRENFLPEGEKEQRELQKMATETAPTEYTGLHKWSNLTGNLLSYVVPIGGGGKLANRALKLGAESELGGKIMTGLVFGNDIYEEELKKNKNPALAYLSAAMQTLLWTKGSEIFGNVTKGMIRSASPEINKTIQSLMNGAIDNKTAASEISNTLWSKIKGVPSVLGKTASNTAKSAGEVSGIQMLNTSISGLLNGKFDLNDVALSGIHTFGDMSMGMALPSLIKSIPGAKKTITDFHNEILKNKEEFQSQIKDPEALKNFNRLVEIDEIVNQYPDLTKKQKDALRLAQLQQEVLKEKSENTKIEELKKKEKEEIDRLAKEKEDIIEGKIAPLEKPTIEQQLKELQEGDYVVFSYENESQVPEVFKDKISSRGVINGKPVVRVTVAKSLADYELGKKEGVEEVKVEDFAKKLNPSSVLLNASFGEKVSNYVNKDGVEVTLKEDQNGGYVNGNQVQGDVMIDFIGNDTNRGKGAASRELDRIIKEADKNDLSISLIVDSEGATNKGKGAKGLGNEELKKWYESRGFVFDKGSSYGYRPKSSENKSIYKKDVYISKQGEISTDNLEYHSSPQDLQEAFSFGNLKDGTFHEDGDGSVYKVENGKLKEVQNVKYIAYENNKFVDRVDYETPQEKSGVEQPEVQPTEAELPSEKVVDVDKEIQKRQKTYAEPKGNQAEINKFVSDVNKYNNMPNGRLGKGTIQGLAERNRLMAEAERLGVSFKAHGKNKFILTDAKYIDKTSSNLAIDKNFKPITERSEKAQSLLSEVDDLVSKYGLSPEMVLPNDIMGADGKRMNMGQIRNALKDIKNNIPSKGANLLLDAIEAMAEKGVVEIRDGQRLDSVPIDEYFQEMRNIGENSTKIEESAIKEAETMTDEALDIWLNEMSKEMEFESDEPYLSKEKQKEYDESITESPETEIGEQPEVQPTITGEEAKVGGEIGVEPVTEKLQAETGGVEPPTVETEVIGTTEPTKLGIKHSETEKIRERYGLPEYERETTKDVELEAEADKLISEGYDIEKLLKKIEGKTPPTGVENFILAKYIASLDAEIENNPNNKSLIENNTQKIKRVLEASDRIGSLQSEAFRTRKVLIPKDDSLASRFITEMEILGVDELTDSQREKITTEYQLEKTAKEAYEKRIAELEAENSRLKAEGEIKKLAKQKGAKRNYAQERKEIVQNIKDKLKELRKGTQSTIVPYANELITIAPDVAKLVKNLLDEGVVKFSDVVKKVYDSLKEDIPNIQEKDVVDLIAGNYNEKKPKKNELAAKLFELKQQAKLVDKYEKLLSGVEPKSEKKQIKVNQELADLRKKIKEHDLTQLANYKKRTQSQIEKVENDLKTGNFSKEVEKEPLKLDAEAIKLKDELIKVKTQRQVRIMREAYENRGRFEKNKDWILDKLNVPRSIMASMDYSAPLRQGLVAFVARPTIGFRALPGMFKSSFSQKNFDRFMYDMRDNPRFEIAQKSGLSITDPQSPFLQAKEEVFMNNTAEKIPLVGKMIKGSERAYVMFLNKIRFDSFNRIVDAYESQGKTMENSPELYKATAKLINSETGRGDLGALETAAPILNSLFFSPRLIASRFNLLTNWANPYWYKNTPKEVRVMYAKDMLKFIGAGLTILALAKMGGANVEDDPRSSDFGKIKVGKTRWDIWGGFQQYARLLSQMATGQKKTATTGEIQELDEKGKFGETRGDVAKRFFRGKLAPVPAIITDVLTGRKVTGEEVTLKDEALSYAIPLIINDVSDAVKDKGISALFTVGVPATFGIGVQTFGEREPQIPKKINFSGYTIDLNDKQYEFFEKKSKDKINEYVSKAEKSPDFNKLTEIEKEKLRSIARKEAIRYTEYVIAKNQDFRKDFIEKAKVKMKEKQEREKENVKLKKIIK